MFGLVCSSGTDSNIVQSVLAYEDIKQVCAPACSPDLNPIEKVFQKAVANMQSACKGNVAILSVAQLELLSKHCFCEAACESGNKFIEALSSAWTNVVVQQGSNKFQD